MNHYNRSLSNVSLLIISDISCTALQSKRIRQENEESIEGNEEPSPIHRVVRKILDQSSLEDVIINNRIIECFQSKIKELIKKGKNATKQGGASFKRLISKWQSGTKQYNFKVYFSETSKIGLHRNINKLKAEKRKLESRHS